MPFTLTEDQLIVTNEMINNLKSDTKMRYEFVLDTQFLSSKEINYEELKMINKIIDILENNRDFVLSKLKKYTVEEYEKEVEFRKKQSEMMMNALMNSLKGKI